MTKLLGYKEMAAMLSAAGKNINDNVERLSKLDSITGDGDHGTTMARIMTAVTKQLTETKEDSLKSFLHDLGWNIMGQDGGSTTTLLGSLFQGFSEGIPDGCDSLDASAAAIMFEAGLKNMASISKAKPGDKTMMDALVPAVEAFHQASVAGKDIETCLQIAADAACKGTEATKKMVAKFGRAKNLGERVIGHIDAGATSISLMFKGFLTGFTTI